MQRVIIADVKSAPENGALKGHVLAVAQNYVDIFRGAADIYVAGGPSYQGKFRKFIPLPYNVITGDSAWKNKWRVLGNVRHLLRECKGDIVVMQSNAVSTAMLGIALFKKKGTKLLMIQYNTDALSSPLKRLLYRLAMRRIDGILCPLKDIAEAYGRKACIVPDYIYSARQDSAPLPYEERTYDFCMLGLICRDKGMLEAVRHLAGSACKVLIAGYPAEQKIGEELEAACRGADHMNLQLRYLSAEEYVSYIRKSRYCVLNYSGAYARHTSGVVFDMLFHGTPVIGSRCKALQMVEEFGIGRNYSSIEELVPQELLQKEVHDSFLRALNAYYQQHLEYREKLIHFVLQP